MSDPVVSICCTTYNHEAFIKAALDGFVMQSANFPYEILINDDASTDRTLEVLQKYAATYSNIKLVTHEKNQWKEGMLNGTFFGFEPFINNLLPIAKGKYIAFCEGDDFWTDHLKLQKQVDYLKSHPECIMCYHSYVVLQDNKISEQRNGKYYTARELISVPHGIASSTKMFRNIYSEDKKEEISKFRGDYLFTSYMGTLGDCGFVEEVKPSVYRRHMEGVWTRLDEVTQKIRYQEMLKNLYDLHLKYGTDESVAIRKSLFWDRDTFGIVLPTYQREDGRTPGLLKRALNSIFAQTYSKFKIYLIGDKYENETELSNIVSQYPSESIYYENLLVAHEREKYPIGSRDLWCSGGVFATNYAISKIKADRIQYACFLDHDDQWLPNHLQILHEAIKETGAHWLCTKTDVNKSMYLPRIVTDESMVEFLPISEGLIKSSSCFDIYTIPLRFRDVLAETGSVFPSDADLWGRMNSFIKKYKLKSYYLNTLSCIYVLGGNVSPSKKLISWRTGKSKPIPRKLTWRQKIAAAQDRLIIKRSETDNLELQTQG